MKVNNGFYIHQKQEDYICANIDHQKNRKRNKKHNKNKADEILFYLNAYPNNRKLSILNMAIDSVDKRRSQKH